MSGPKGIQYQIQQARLREERALASAHTEWSRLASAVRRFQIGCEVSGQMDLDVSLPATPTGDSAAWRRACEKLQNRLAAASEKFDSRRREELHRQVEHDISAAVAELERAEESRIATALEDTRARVTASTDAPAATADAVPTREDVRESVNAELRRLTEASPELSRLGALVIAADTRRSRVLLADLANRVSAANRSVAARREHERTIDELRARADSRNLADVGSGPDPAIYLDRAEVLLAGGGDPGTDLQTATDILAGLERLATERVERRFVLRAVTESLSELGYTVYGTEVGTADTVLLRPRAASTDAHLVRVEVDDDEVGIRTVRTSGSITRQQDVAADEALCADLGALMSGLSGRGVTGGRIRRTEAGAVIPPVVEVRESTAGSDHAAAAEAERRRRSRIARERHGGIR